MGSSVSLITITVLHLCLYIPTIITKKTFDFLEGSFKVGSHDPFFGLIILLALFQFIQMLIRVNNFSEFE